MIILNSKPYQWSRCYCTGIELAAVGLGLSAAGMGAQVYGAHQSQQAQNQKVEDELQRQRQYQKQADVAYRTAVSQSGQDVANQQIQQGTDQRTAEFAKLMATPPGATGQPSSPLSTAPQTVEEKAYQGQGVQTALAGARLGGLTEWDLLQQVKNMRAAQNIGLINNFARGSQNVMPYEVANAAHAGDMANAIGGLAQTGGQLVSLAGIMSPFWGASAPKAAASVSGTLPSDFNFTPVGAGATGATNLHPLYSPFQFQNGIWNPMTY